MEDEKSLMRKKGIFHLDCVLPTPLRYIADFESHIYFSPAKYFRLYYNFTFTFTNFTSSCNQYFDSTTKSSLPRFPREPLSIHCLFVAKYTGLTNV